MADKSSPILWRALSGGALLGGATGLAISYLLPYFLPPGSSPYWLVVFLPAFLVVAIIHEAGHLAAARLEGLILLSWEASGFVSDGARLVLLARYHPAADRWCSLAALAGMAHRGPRPIDWDPRILARAIQLEDGGPEEVRARLFNYYAALDSGKLTEVARHLHRLSEIYSRMPRPLQAEYWLEQAYFSGHLMHDRKLASAALVQAGSAPLAPPYRLARARAAVLSAGGEAGQAMQVASQALADWKDHRATGLAGAERDWLRHIADPASAVWQPGIEYSHTQD